MYFAICLRVCVRGKNLFFIMVGERGTASERGWLGRGGGGGGGEETKVSWS